MYVFHIYTDSSDAFQMYLSLTLSLSPPTPFLLFSISIPFDLACLQDQSGCYGGAGEGPAALRDVSGRLPDTS